MHMLNIHMQIHIVSLTLQLYNPRNKIQCLATGETFILEGVAPVWQIYFVTRVTSKENQFMLGAAVQPSLLLISTSNDRCCVRR